MTFTTKDLKLTAYLTALGYDLSPIVMLIYKNLDNHKPRPNAYQITLQDYNDKGQSIKQAMSNYTLPKLDKPLTAGELCYVIGANLDALRDSKNGKLYAKTCKNYTILSAKPAKDYILLDKPCPISGEIEKALYFACGGELPRLDDPSLDEEDNYTPLAIAKAYLDNLQTLTDCPKVEKLVISTEGRTLFINKNATKEEREKALKCLNS